MDLSEALAKAPLFGICAPADEPALHQILESSPMRVAGMELCYDRKPAFDGYLRYLSEKFFTVVGRRQDQVRAFSSFSWGPRLVDGKETTAVYIGDFRVLPDRRLSVGWRKLYPDILDAFFTSRDLGPCAWAFTAILKDNVPAYRSLVDARPGKTFFYHSIAELTMVNTFFRRPWAKGPTRNLRLVSGTDVGEAALRDFLVRNARLFLGYRFDRAPSNEWERRQKSWPGFELGAFMVLIDAQGQIQACTLPWAPRAKKIRVKKATRATTIGYRLLNLTGMKMPQIGHTVDTLYLSHLYFGETLSDAGKADAIAHFLDALSRSGQRKQFHMISYCDPGTLRSHAPLRAYFSQTTGVEVFTVTTTPTGPEMPAQHGVGFEMCLA